MPLLSLNCQVVNLSRLNLLELISMREGVFADLFRGDYLGVVHVDLVDAVIDLCPVELSEYVLAYFVVCHEVTRVVSSKELIKMRIDWNVVGFKLLPKGVCVERT